MKARIEIDDLDPEQARKVYAQLIGVPRHQLWVSAGDRSSFSGTARLGHAKGGSVRLVPVEGPTRLDEGARFDEQKPIELDKRERERAADPESHSALDAIEENARRQR